MVKHGFGNFLRFWLICGWLSVAGYRPKKVKNAIIENDFFFWIFFCWELSKQISKNVIKRFGFCQFSSFFCKKRLIRLKKAKKGLKRLKKAKIENLNLKRDSVLICRDASTNKILENFIERFRS
jgi:hypothetical protein